MQIYRREAQSQLLELSFAHLSPSLIYIYYEFSLTNYEQRHHILLDTQSEGYTNNESEPFSSKDHILHNFVVYCKPKVFHI